MAALSVILLIMGYISQKFVVTCAALALLTLGAVPVVAEGAPAAGRQDQANEVKPGRKPSSSTSPTLTPASVLPHDGLRFGGADIRFTRAVVRSVGQDAVGPPRIIAPRALAEPDEFDSLPLGGLAAQTGNEGGARSRVVVRSLAGVPTMVAHDCALAENGDAGAAYRLGRRYLFGMGLPRDKRMGVAWMRAAASRGFPAALQISSMVPRDVGRMRPWCRTSLSPLRRPSAPPAEIVRLVREIAPAHGIDPNLVLAVIQIESAFHTNAMSPKEAAGLMQLIPATAERFGVHNVFEPQQNILGGVKYLRWLLSYFEGNVTLALAGYNAGERAVDRYGGVPPYAETQAYVRLIHGLYPRTMHRFEAGVAVPSIRFARQTADAGR